MWVHGLDVVGRNRNCRFGHVDTLSMLALGCITIVAKDLESWWETFHDEPLVELPTTLDTTERLPSMLVPMAFYMINDEEISFRFAAASALGWSA